MERKPTLLRPVDGTRMPQPSGAGWHPAPDVPGDAHESIQVLVARAQGGDMQAWARLYQEHFDGLFRHLRYLSGDAQLAEELVQESFVRALCSIDRYDGEARFSTWLHGIGVNVVRNHWRSQRSTARAHAKLSLVQAAADEGDAPTPDATVLCRQRARALYEALETLPEHLREAFILRDLEGLPPAEAAAQLGITPNNLAVRASRARTRIRRLLARMRTGEWRR